MGQSPRLADRARVAAVLFLSRYCFDEHVGATHILYTPLRLRAILREAGFTAVHMEVFFCESPCLREEAARVYGLEGGDAVLYELLVVCRNPPADPGPRNSSCRGGIGVDRQRAARGESWPVHRAATTTAASCAKCIAFVLARTRPDADLTGSQG